MHAELTLGRGIVVARHSVELLMQRGGLQGLSARPKYRRGVRPEATATDLVDRAFGRTGVNHLWVTDITEYPTREGKLCCARRLLPPGRGLVDRQQPDRRAGHERDRDGDRFPPARGDDHSLRPRRAIHLLGLHRTGQGVRAGALDGQRRGSVGDCFDNAFIEAFSRMQVELLDHQRWTTRIELANAIFEYLEIFHNRLRRHGALGMLTPVEYENRPLHVVA